MAVVSLSFQHIHTHHSSSSVSFHLQTSRSRTLLLKRNVKNKNSSSVLSDQAEIERRAALEATTAEEEAARSAPLVAEAERNLAAAERELAEARAKLSEAAGGRKRRLESLRAALALYERTLGLKFVMPQAAAETEGEGEDGENDDEERQQTEQQRQQNNNSSSNGGELKVVFSHVDPRDPPREFSLGLRLSPGGDCGRSTYSVLRCEPAACLGALRRLCDALNSHPGEFAWFVREVRAEFRARAADEAAAGGGRLL